MALVDGDWNGFTMDRKPVEFCQERIIDQQDVDIDPKDKVAVASAVNACYRAAQPEIAQRLEPGFTLREFRCATDKEGKDKPKGSI
jgi:hypothetical protein